MRREAVELDERPNLPIQPDFLPMRYVRRMDRAAVQRYFAGFEKAATVQRRLEVEEARDVEVVVAKSLALIDTLRRTIPRAELETQASRGDEAVRATWARLRRKLLG